MATTIKAKIDNIKQDLAKKPLPKFLNTVSCVVGNQTVVYHEGMHIPNDYVLLTRLKESGAVWS